MKIVCAASVYQAREAFAGLGEVCLRPDRDIRREHLREARALIVRSKTRVGPELLADTPVEFVATATAGSDHLDLPWLEEAGIAWSAAAGCNANAVAEYAITALTWLALRHGALLAGKTLGLVGLGQVGSRVAEKAPCSACASCATTRPWPCRPARRNTCPWRPSWPPPTFSASMSR